MEPEDHEQPKQSFAKKSTAAGIKITDSKNPTESQSPKMPGIGIKAETSTSGTQQRTHPSTAY